MIAGKCGVSVQVRQVAGTRHGTRAHTKGSGHRKQLLIQCWNWGAGSRQTGAGVRRGRNLIQGSFRLIKTVHYAILHQPVLRIISQGSSAMLCDMEAMQ